MIDKFSLALTLMREAFEGAQAWAAYLPCVDLAAKVDGAQRLINAASAVQAVRVTQYAAREQEQDATRAWVEVEHSLGHLGEFASDCFGPMRTPCGPRPPRSTRHGGTSRLRGHDRGPDRHDFGQPAPDPNPLIEPSWAQICARGYKIPGIGVIGGDVAADPGQVRHPHRQSPAQRTYRHRHPNRNRGLPPQPGHATLHPKKRRPLPLPRLRPHNAKRYEPDHIIAFPAADQPQYGTCCACVNTPTVATTPPTPATTTSSQPDDAALSLIAPRGGVGQSPDIALSTAVRYRPGVAMSLATSSATDLRSSSGSASKSLLIIAVAPDASFRDSN